MSKKIAIGSETMGLPLKVALKQHLEGKGYEVIDLGIENTPIKGAKALQDGIVERAIIICGTGMNVALTANKFKGVYCGLCESEFTAELCKAVNNCNMLAMGARVVSEYRANRMVDIWLSTELKDGIPEDEKQFMDIMFNNLQQIEAENMK